jgi:sugar/nucleoside kinase (ribokinase family)
MTHDHVGDGKLRLGGAALYASLTAHRLGKTVSVLTSYGDDFLGKEAIQGIETKVVRAAQTSSFQNLYEEGGRVQYVYEEAASLHPGDLPGHWTKAPIAYLCPVLHEVPVDMGRSVASSLIGVAPQGWMRAWDQTGRIRARRWEGFEGVLDQSHMVIVSEEDLAGEWGLLEAFRKHAPIVILTRAGQGAVVYTGGRRLSLGAYPAAERDPTGAGDCFGAAFLVRLAETGDLEEAGRFASCVGACVVEEEGIAGIPTRQVVEDRMRKHCLSCEWKG